MNLDSISIFAPDLAQEIPPDPILAYVSAHHEALWHAARLLGGYESARLVDRCAELLAQDRRVTSRTRMMLDQILAMLSLEEVDNPNLPYMGHFAVIDPLDPVVEEICLLTDGLRHELARTVSEALLRPDA
ncbi:hypothetical protein [Citreimonas salinaria]|uniref:Uncharacterized protein n=1 Tax=Citreimonas salinaria TaxID=321339 RepID=A0A1H3IFX5_9RHOB|nr:hypothetical protein [Citreimonas salinaria]SDY25978.1 hypothetical protein SAMN05444340_10510 [Citreimonas salinaria]